MLAPVALHFDPTRVFAVLVAASSAEIASSKAAATASSPTPLKMEPEPPTKRVSIFVKLIRMATDAILALLDALCGRGTSRVHPKSPSSAGKPAPSLTVPEGQVPSADSKDLSDTCSVPGYLPTDLEYSTEDMEDAFGLDSPYLKGFPTLLHASPRSSISSASGSVEEEPESELMLEDDGTKHLVATDAAHQLAYLPPQVATSVEALTTALLQSDPTLPYHSSILSLSLMCLSTHGFDDTAAYASLSAAFERAIL